MNKTNLDVALSKNTINDLEEDLSVVLRMSLNTEEMILDREHLHLVVVGISKHFGRFRQHQHFVLMAFDDRHGRRNLVSEVITSRRNSILHDGYVSKFKFWSLPCSSHCSSPYSSYDLKWNRIFLLEESSNLNRDTL